MRSISLIQAMILIDQGPSISASTKKNRKVDCFKSTRGNVAMAKKLVDQILGRHLSIRSLKTKVLYLLIEEMAIKIYGRKCSGLPCSIKNVLDYTGWNRRVLVVHIQKLEKLGYLYRDDRFVLLLDPEHIE